MKWIFFIAGIFMLSPARAQKKLSLSSPGKKISFSFRITKESPLYSVLFNEDSIIVNSEMGLNFLETGEFKSNLVVGKPQYRKGEEKYELIVGKSRFVHQHYNELLIPLEEKAGHFRKINFVIRAFDDGLAFRFEFPTQKNRGSISLTQENTCFNFNGDPKVLALLLPNYTTSHEGEYSSLRLSEIKEDTLIDMPALFAFPKGIY